MRLGALLDTPDLGLRLLAGPEARDREFARVFQATLRDPTRYLDGGEIVLCGLRWLPGPNDADEFVGKLAAAGVVALGAGTAETGGPVPEYLVHACRRTGLPLFEVPVSVSFATVAERVILGLAAERSAPARDSHRRLVTAATAGHGLDALIEAGAEELGAQCWVLSTTGAQLAGGSELPVARRAALTGRFLRADRLPCRDGALTLLPAAGRSGHRVASWFVAVDGDPAGWPAPRAELVQELAALVGLERSRVDEARRIENRGAEPLLRLVLSGETTELASRLAAAGLPAHEPVGTVSAEVRGGGPGFAQALLVELLAAAGAPALVATVDGEIFGLFAAPRPAVTAAVREAVHTVEPALGSARLAVGLSRAADAGGLRSGIQEARHARALASLDPGRATVLAGDEVASHLLLLAAVPEDLRRSFGEKVLGPVLAYDAGHGSELMSTLRVFLEHSGSWTQTSAALHLHVNTLRYRIARVGDLTGRDLGRFADRVDLYLAGCFTRNWGWSPPPIPGGKRK
ncbi:helix-turn-helix domain-containing protein [Amycolatopsis jiangsuensis]|uniref:Sugar diacid utilization regulator n=1 Tax=Amycolatopsis jiangsuensis TaxID=1181879 RepID=A0A840J694_9PSEU|nr:helix-turn-helix domain-containing protein [Amycolatopsis jiangsuensis]MBB4688927.1 sugar diacid utilization regulator [Amycolatopsis jiangsuensis]